MKKSPYILKDLSIRKIPGFPSGMSPLRDLAANVNIITGPNGSGKSSTARAILQLIWQNNTKGISIQGSVKIDEDNWEIDIDSGRNRAERNGQIEQIKGLPALEGHHRYLLALHNFIEGNENDLAKEIAKQSIGGFDLDAAQYNLGYTSRIQTLGATEYKNLNKTKAENRAIREKQKSLKKQEEHLIFLEENKGKAREADKLNAFYNKVAEYLEVKFEAEQLSEQLKDFLPSMKSLSGKELENVEELESQIEEYQSKIKTAETDIKNSKIELNKLYISEGGIDDKIIEENEIRIEDLSKINRDISDIEEKIYSEKVKEQTALDSIDSSINPTEWKNIDIHDVGGLDKMLRDAHQIVGEREFILAEIRILEEESGEFQNQEKRSETFFNGIKTLSDWLKEPIETKGIPLKTVIIIAAFGILSAIATYFIGWMGILIAIVLFIIAFFIAKSTSGNSSPSLDLRQNDFTKSGLKPPSTWDTHNVSQRIDELIESLIDNKESERITQRLKGCKTKLQNIQTRMNEQINEREKWVNKLQSAPGFPKVGSTDFSSFYWFLTNVKSWQEANIQRGSLESLLEEKQNQADNELALINDLFRQSNLGQANDLTIAKTLFTQLKKEENMRKNHSQTVEQKQSHRTEQAALKKRDSDKIIEIYNTVGIENNDKVRLQSIISQLENFKTIDQNHFSTNQEFSKIENQLKNHFLFDEKQAELKELTIEEAKEKAIQNLEIAGELDAINQEITQIETLIKEQKKSHELEDLLTQKDEDLEALHQLYETNLALSTGDFIIAELKKETQNKNRPEVFQKANEIFNQITLGRYNLKLNEKSDIRFEAIDNNLKRSFNLAELSTGTRVQLLLAVRLAYVETVESSIKLPLLADELLANSDDERAKAIIEALIEISRQGRQVFYFTAQADEVGKWKNHLDQTELEYKIIELSSEGNQALNSTDFNVEFGEFSLSQEIPLPNNKTHKEYGDLISVPSFNLLTQNSTELPLWYLIDDVDLLYSILKKGIKTWGQLESYFKNNGKIDQLDEGCFQQLSNLIEVLKRFQELHKIGRSLRIDRTVLQYSGAVSESFIDEVSEKLSLLNGSPVLLIQAIKNGEVSRFRSDSLEKLEHYLLSEGYIDDKEKLDTDEIMIRMQALISNMEVDEENVEGFLERVLKSS